MIRVLILWSLVAVTWHSALADSHVEIDETFNFSVTRDIPYLPARLDQGVEPLQTLDLYLPHTSVIDNTDESASAQGLPVVVYIHGGGWAFGDKSDVHLKPHFFTRNGYAFISINYRLRWDFKVYDQLVDIVAALRWISEADESYTLDASRIVLMGHAAGGHLASLVMTDPSYLRAEGMSGKNVKAVVSIDSASYDIPRLMRELGSFVERRQHELIFTGEETVWQAASPVTHAANRSADQYLPAFALLYNPERDAASLQARGFAKALTGSEATVIMIPGSSDAPSQTDELIGTAGNITTGALMAFLRSQI